MAYIPEIEGSSKKTVTRLLPATTAKTLMYTIPVGFNASGEFIITNLTAANARYSIYVDYTGAGLATDSEALFKLVQIVARATQIININHITSGATISIDTDLKSAINFTLITTEYEQ